MTPDPIAWSHVSAEIDLRCGIDAAMLARALRALGLVREATICRGIVPGWPPEYQRFTPWRARYMSCGSLRARGWRQRAWQDMAAGEADMDAQDARERAAVAEENRYLRDAPVFLLSRASVAERDSRHAAQADALRQHDRALAEWFALPAPRPARPVPMPVGAMPRDFVFLELDTFAWRDRTGAAFGEGLCSLAAFAWQVGQGKATARLARLLGVEMVGVRELDRRVQKQGAQASAAA